ncbi:FAD-dependent oxidoreductase [Paractinoplanes atraurantiacus]|uniref:2-polyprenyl-6-methoxyphenol hydroxylase n=1 Tax=Paractinoplanes atraurantiacus TaxID=1036182 RepID=A0A285I4U0_9ACTN|nr:FAD-dependent oxidoreductase [Actinoplanes atraurantiacus]SNY42990.1 2-polyprenyl-6-methoxyphenol hydroxylase [Actinoplanes atraurantiacus]
MEDVIVVGAGPTGLWLSAELALAGLSVTVLERRPAPAEFSKAMGVHARTLEVLAMRGVAEPLLKAGKPLPTWHWGFLPSRLDLTALDTPYPFMLAVPQTRTEAALEEHALRLGVRIERGHPVGAVHAYDDHVVVDGVEARYVVGADGGGSAVRKAAGIGFPGTGGSVVAFVADAVLDDPPPPGFSVVGPAGSLILAPAPGGRFRVAGYDPQHQDTAAPFPVEDLRDFLIRVTGGDFGLREAYWLSRFGNATRMASAYRAGRVLLAGDAAHIHFPTGGVGLNTGIQDAMNLGWKLAAVIRGEAPSTFLDTYESERRPVSEAVAADTQAQTVLLTAITPEGAALRAAVSAMVAQPGINLGLAQQISGLSVAYPSGGRAPASTFPLLHAGRPIPLPGDESLLIRPDGYLRPRY